MKLKKFTKKKSIILLLSLLCCVFYGTTQQPASYQASVFINTHTPAKIYDPMIFGGFLEHFGKQIYGGVFDPGSPLSDNKGFRIDVIEALKELKIPVIRWPGGCFVDGYHWMNGIGKNRKPKDDIRWGVVESNTFGTNEFVEFCRLLNAEPYICQNGLADVQEMSDWVEYCNATEGKFADMRKKNGYPAPLNVKIWSVGNERSDRDYIHRVRDGGKAMKKVDSTILVTCSGTHGGARLDPYLFETAGEYLNYISVHQYWIANFQKHYTPNYLSCMVLSEKPELYIKKVVNSIHQAEAEGLIEKGQIKIALDEWNLRSWHHPGFQRNEKVDYNDPEIIKLINARDKSLNPAIYNLSDALFAASFFNSCLRHSENIAMANIAPLVNQTGPLYVHSKGIVKRTHFHSIAMYANELEEYVSNATINGSKLTYGKDSVSVVDAISTVDKKGENWAISLVNRHPSEILNCKVIMGDKPLNGTYKAKILTGESTDTYNDIEHPNRVAPEEVELKFKKGVVNLPPHSLTIVHIRGDYK
ncbi:MAG: hypothetical protein KAK04_09855 [Cyclobacteriaceae bacterium]|nr:hypothetical protein [Cyclobacteriaceae bacterium]